MWKNRIVGILGLFLILVPFLGFSFGAERITLIVIGIVIAVFSFWSSVGSSGPKRFSSGMSEMSSSSQSGERPASPQGPSTGSM